MFLKSLLLSSVRPFYEAEKEQGTEKTDKDKQRDAVNMSDSTTNDKIKGEDNTNENDDDKGNDDNKDDDNKDDDEEKEEEVEEKEDETKELTAEQKAIAKLEKTVERLQKRVGRTVGERDAIKRELAAAKTQLETKVADGEGLTEDEVERRANERAQQISVENDFKKQQAKLIKDATKVDPKFMEKVKEMAAEVAPIPDFMIAMLDDLDNGGAVLSHLTNNVDDYEEILQLSSPIKMARRLDKISEQLIEATKPKKKAISQVPPPNEPIKGNERSPMVLTGKEDMETFARVRAQQVEARRKLKMGM